MTDTNPAAAIYDGLTTFPQLAEADGSSERKWRRLCDRLGVKIVYMGRDPYVDIADLKAKLRGEQSKHGRGRPRNSVAA